MTSPDVVELERELRATLNAAAERHSERHVQLMELLDGRPARDVDWEAWDRLSALQQADWAIIDGAQKQLSAMGRVHA